MEIRLILLPTHQTHTDLLVWQDCLVPRFSPIDTLSRLVVLQEVQSFRNSATPFLPLESVGEDETESCPGCDRLQVYWEWRPRDILN